MDSKEFTITVLDPPTLAQIEVLWKNGGCIALARTIAASIRYDLKTGALIVRNGKVITAGSLQTTKFGDIIGIPAPMTIEEEVS